MPEAKPKPLTITEAARLTRKLAAMVYRGETLFDSDSLDLDRIAMLLESMDDQR